MLVAFAAVAALLFLFAFFGLVAFAHLAEMKERKRLRKLNCNGILAGICYEQAFDENYALIWQTQIPALQMVGEARQGIQISALKPLFRSLAKCYPDLYDGYCFEQWLNFLEQSRLIGLHEKRVLLTPEGRGFLEHCRVAH